MAFLPAPPNTGHISETDGFNSNNWGAEFSPTRAMKTTKRRPHSTSSAGCIHHDTNHMPFNGQHTPRKDVAGTRAKNSTHAKNIRLLQATQELSHIKTALLDHSR